MSALDRLDAARYGAHYRVVLPAVALAARALPGPLLAAAILHADQRATGRRNTDPDGRHGRYGSTYVDRYDRAADLALTIAAELERRERHAMA